jgi:hypothetical protein
MNGSIHAAQAHVDDLLRVAERERVAAELRRSARFAGLGKRFAGLRVPHRHHEAGAGIRAANPLRRADAYPLRRRGTTRSARPPPTSSRPSPATMPTSRPVKGSDEPFVVAVGVVGVVVVLAATCVTPGVVLTAGETFELGDTPAPGC